MADKKPKRMSASEGKARRSAAKPVSPQLAAANKKIAAMKADMVEGKRRTAARPAKTVAASPKKVTSNTSVRAAARNGVKRDNMAVPKAAATLLAAPYPNIIAGAKVAKAARQDLAKNRSKQPKRPAANASVRAAAYRAANAEGKLWGPAKPKTRPMPKGPEARKGSRPATLPMEATFIRKKKETPAGKRGSR